MSDESPKPAADTADAAKKLLDAVDKRLARPAAEAQGQVHVAGRAEAMNYLVRAEFLPVLAAGFEGATGDPEAAVMTTSYCLEGADAAARPVCFAFNGGPGSASLWLHLGALGPKRVVVPDDSSPARAPYPVVDNPLTWFEHFDLVFIDPPHTGWSITASEAARKKMLSVDGDVAALTEVMRQWLTRHRRWASPVYMAGESYGTTRGAALADAMQTAGVALSGLILVSCAMDLQTIAFAPANELPYALFLPAYATVAQYHGLLKGAAAASPAAARQAAEAYVADEYLAALHAGNGLDQARRRRVARRVSELSGLPLAVVEDNNLRISDRCFFTQALRAQGRVVGRLEARATGPLGATRSHDFEFDPGIEAIAPAYTASMLAYYGQVLGLSIDARYEALNGGVNRGWDWNRGDTRGMGFTSTTPDLARALRRNAHLRVLVASGRYDLGTPYSASDWSLAHLDVDADVMARVQHRYYDAGHMMYTRSADLAQLKADLTRWLQEG